MSKMVCITVLASLMLFAFGCGNPDKRFQEPADAFVEPEAPQTFMMPEAAEVDRVEEMAMYRNMYRSNLEKLVQYYTKTGDQMKLSWARSELKSFDSTPKYKYIMEAIIADPDLEAVDLIIEADELYAEAEKIYKNANALIVMVDKDKLRLALNKYNEIIGLYPTSDKIDDAAYRAGRIYDHFKDYNIAVIYYQRAFQWNVNTRYPARSRAAYIMDKRLNRKEDALTLYQLAYKYEKQFPNNVEYAKTRILELTAGDKGLDNDTTAVPGDGVKIEDVETP